MNGKTMLWVYALMSRIGNPAKAVRKGFTLALRGFRSSYAPISPAIRTVDRKLRNRPRFSGKRYEPSVELTAIPTMNAMPPISGMLGRSFLLMSSPTIPFFLIIFIIVGELRKQVANAIANMISASNISDTQSPNHSISEKHLTLLNKYLREK